MINEWCGEVLECSGIFEKTIIIERVSIKRMENDGQNSLVEMIENNNNNNNNKY